MKALLPVACEVVSLSSLYPGTAWAGIKADFEAHGGFQDDPEAREKNLNRPELQKITRQTGRPFNISNFR